MSKAKKIFVGNYKGGVGKTTSIYQIGRQMVLLGKRVLLIDLDPQCSLSEICLRNQGNLDQLKSEECLNYIYDMWLQFKEYPNIEYTLDKNALIKANIIGMDYIPSNIFYKNGGLDELAMKMTNDLEDLLVLQQFIKKHEIDKDYEYILFDCPPSNSTITQGAFLMSDYYLIPTIVQTISIRGVSHYISTVEKIYKKYCEEHRNADIAKLIFGSKPELLGIFETLKKGTVKNGEELNEFNSGLSKTNVDTLLKRKNKGNYLFSTIINNYEDIARSTAKGEICNDYKGLTNEIIGCIED